VKDSSFHTNYLPPVQGVQLNAPIKKAILLMIRINIINKGKKQIIYLVKSRVVLTDFAASNNIMIIVKPKAFAKSTPSQVLDVSTPVT